MRLFYFSFFFLVVFLSVKPVYAQHTQIPLAKIYTDSLNGKLKDTTTVVEHGTPQKDMYDVLTALLHKKKAPVKDSVTAKPEVSIVPAIGYTLVSRLAVVVSGNVAWRTGPDSRVSTIVGSTSYTQNKQFTIPILTSIWSKSNNYNFVGDYRYLKYPQDTYGLGSNSDINNDEPMDYSFIRFNESVYRHVFGNFYAGVGYIFDDHYDITYQDIDTDDPTHPGLIYYGRPRRAIASGFTLNLLFDSRDNGINASKGIYANINFRTSYKDLGSTNQWQSIVVDLRKYIRFPAGSDNILALWSYDWLILNGRPAYLDLPSTGWDAASATGRGYIQGRFRGAQMVYGEAEYRFKLTANGLVGGVIFANGESFSSVQGSKLQSFQPAVGPGLRLKLNKISKTNITIDYGFGTEGSRGLFIDVGEVF